MPHEVLLPSSLNVQQNGVGNMELYKTVSYELSKQLTRGYSTSFSMSSRLFDASIRPDIYAVYGLVRLADEIVDTYDGSDDEKRVLLDALEAETYEAMARQYSTNPLVHAFALTAKRYDISRLLIAPFFVSMRMDIGHTYTSEQYEEYIYGSAEVVGLMCLKVFCGGDESRYHELEQGARMLGSAYQKVNFLRDFASDYAELGRVYFPDVQFETFSERQKRTIVQEIEREFSEAATYLDQLPKSAQKAVRTSRVYYRELLENIKKVSVDTLKTTRVRVNTSRKIWLLMRTAVGGGL